VIITNFQPPVAEKQNFLLSSNQKLLIMPVGDVHAYSPNWPEKRFQDHLKWGMDQGAHFLGMGEYLDFTSASQRAILSGLRGSQKSMIDEMVKTQVEKLHKLIAFTNGRWIGLLEGDHYHQYQDGTTADQELCSLLGCPFLGTSTLLDIDLGIKSPERRYRRDVTVTIFAHHGMGGGRKQGSHLHRVEDLITMIEADIYLMGHSHSKANAPLDRLYRTRDGYLYHKTKLIARTGGFLRGYAGGTPNGWAVPADYSRGGYVEDAAYTPSALGGLVISLGAKELKYRSQLGGNMKSLLVPDIHYSV
jgi:hypothetical protein